MKCSTKWCSWLLNGVNCDEAFLLEFSELVPFVKTAYGLKGA